MRLVRLPSFRIQIGEPLPWGLRDKTGRLLLAHGLRVDSKDQLDAMLVHGIYIDTAEVQARYRKLQKQEAPPKLEPLIASTLKTPNSLFERWKGTTEDLRKLMAGLPERPPSPSEVHDFAIYLVELVDRQPDIAIYHMVRQEYVHLFYYGYSHAIHTAVLCLLMARRLRWPALKIMSLVKAALTMNMSILRLQGEMAQQEDVPTPSQLQQIRNHPQVAVECLRRSGVTDPDWLDAVWHHHEREDGSGYPRGVKAASEIAVALRTADVFLAKISARKGRTPMAIQDAVKALYVQDAGGPIATAIVKEFGIFPPGKLVCLASGELGVVVKRTDSVKFPVVAAITDYAGKPISYTVRRETEDPQYAVLGGVTDLSLVANLPPERLFGLIDAAPAPSATPAMPESP